MWGMPHGLDETLNPIGIPGSNPEKGSNPCLEIEFERFSPTISYPPESQIEDLAQRAANRDHRQSTVTLVGNITKDGV